LFAVGHINKPGKIAPVYKSLVQIRYLTLSKEEATTSAD